MRAFSTDFKAGTAGDETYLGFLLAVTPVGLPELFLSTIWADYTYAGDVYLGDPGFKMSQMRVTDGSDPAALSVEIPVSPDGPVTPDDVTKGLYVGAAVVLRGVTFESGFVTPPFGFEWSIGKTTITDDGKATFDIRSDIRINRELVLKIFGVPCSTKLGTARCGVNVLADWTDEVTIVDVIDAYSFTVSGARLGAVDGFFAEGAIKFTSGDNVGRSYEVRLWDQSSALVTLWRPLQAGLQAGDVSLIHAGCDLTNGPGGCTKFSNNDRYQGFLNMPGDDAKFSYDGGEVAAVVTNPEVPRFSTGWGSAGGGGGGFR